MEATSNHTLLKNPGDAPVRVRLVFQDANRFATRCNPCKLQLRNGATVADEIVMTGGAPAPGTSGAWVTIDPQQSWAIWASVRATLGNKNCAVSYWLEIQPTSGSSTANYTHMVMTFIV